MTLSAVLLLGGLLLFAVGAAIPPLWRPVSLVPEVWFASHERYLELIGRHRHSWAWMNGLMIAAVVLNAAGLAALATLAEQPALVAGAVGYGIASVFWIVLASYRTTVSLWVADEVADGKGEPNVVSALDRWSDMSYRLYTAIGHGSQAVVGAGLLPTTLVANWVVWVAILVGVAGVLSQLPGTSRIPGLQAFFIPIVIHIPPALIGVSLLI